MFFKRAIECMEVVQQMPALKFNNEQCEYLAEKFQVVLQSTRSFLEVFCDKWHRPGSLGDMARLIEVFKLLVAFAKQIECFIQGCCKDGWIQAAMTLTNVFDYVSSIGFNLELCRVVSCKECATASECLTLDQVADIHKNEIEVVNKKASVDVDALVAKVIHGLTEKSFNSEDNDLAAYLLQRLHGVKPIPISAFSGSSWWSSDKVGVVGNLYKWVKPLKQLEKGASSIVHKAMWLGTRVAKKTFSGRNNPDFNREAEILARLSHPNITSMFCCTKHKYSCSIIMELMDEDLHALMQRCEDRCIGNIDNPPFSILEAVDIMLQVGEGVNYLHNQVTPSIVHRDLKSSNILVKCITRDLEDGYLQAKVTDFGLSKTKEFSTRYSQQTWNTGTNKWMAPEIINLNLEVYGNTSTNEGEPSYPHKCDVYSFAMVYFEILSGHEPFLDELPNDAKRKVMRGEHLELPKYCPIKLKDFIEKCWNQESIKRPSFNMICMELKYLKYLLMIGKF